MTLPPRRTIYRDSSDEYSEMILRDISNSIRFTVTEGWHNPFPNYARPIRLITFTHAADGVKYVIEYLPRYDCWEGGAKLMCEAAMEIMIVYNVKINDQKVVEVNTITVKGKALENYVVAMEDRSGQWLGL